MQIRVGPCKVLLSRFEMAVPSGSICFLNSSLFKCLLQESMVPSMGRRAAAEAFIETELASDEPNGEGFAEIRFALIISAEVGSISNVL